MTEIIHAHAEDAGVLSAVIAEAFLDLPPSRWLIGDEASRRKIFPSYFRIFVEHALANGIVHTTPDRAGAALWIPVGEERPRVPDRYDERLREVTTPWTPRFTEFDTALDSCHLTGTVHHHLALLGVWPGAQGRGIGTALLHAHHHVLDEAGIPAYLEAASPRNRQLYQRHGYTDYGLTVHLAGGPEMYPMLREPQPKPPALPPAPCGTAGAEA